ncbi:hypothetical protein LCGC14_0162770 [marine sediment metagenome]|uniref:VWFA domain-containing protein n=1 Tax=marine sediment metagenome TaxID=412755 RepID=A0A0F9XDB6_9ZZZZ|nr:VWA domain-containing protein [Phycisphaerae bacterium]
MNPAAGDLLALTFAAPAMLIGLLAAAIPVVLHLLASVRAPQAAFPTLRFLQTAMEQTARRRRVQHWLLLILRSLMLGLLALAVAEPISQAVGGWGREHTIAIVLDNSASMAVQTGGTSRFSRAQAQIANLLAGDDKPTRVALLATNGPADRIGLTNDLGAVRAELNRITVVPARAPLAERVREALLMLRQGSGRKTLCVLSDLQRVSFEDLLALTALGEAEDVSVAVVDTSEGPVRNVGITDLTVAGPGIVGGALRWTAELTNASATEQVVRARLVIEDVPTGQPAVRSLRPAGQNGDTATVTFTYRPAQPGTLVGAVALDGSDDLSVDDRRHACVDVGEGVRIAVVRPVAEGAGPKWLEPAAMLLAALDPFDPPEAGPITPKAVAAATFDAGDWAGAGAVFFCQAPQFTPAQSQAVAEFASGGGVVVFFLGPGISAANYNERFIDEISADGGLLPARIGPAVGQVGPNAPAASSSWIDVQHAYFAGLYDATTPVPPVRVQRYYRLRLQPTGGRMLIQLENGDPLLVIKPFGDGRVIVCAVPASPSWSNLPTWSAFLPMVTRMSLLAGAAAQRDRTVAVGAAVSIRPDLSGPGEASAVRIFPPGAEGDEAIDLPLTASVRGPTATFERTFRAGVYRWRVAGPPRERPWPTGAFAVVPAGSESDLSAFGRDELRAHLADREGGAAVGPSLAAALGELAARSQEHRWWDVVVVVVAVALLVEALVANRSRRPAGTAGARRQRDAFRPAGG